jgi:hypothetical protein
MCARLLNEMKANQAKAEADRQVDQERMEANQASMKAHMQEIMEAQFGSLAAQLRTWRKEGMPCQEMTDANQEKMEAIVHTSCLSGIRRSSAGAARDP